VAATAQPAVADERVWLKRAVLVLVAPRMVLAGIRDDSDDAARARSEAVLALVILAGIASVLWSPVGGRVMDVNGVHAQDGLDVALWAFIGGSLYGAVLYFGGGLLLYLFTRIVGGITYRQVRHVLAFASAPIALSLLLVWPVRIAVYGEDVFRSGGADRGAGNWVFVGLGLALLVWSLALLALGIRIVLSNPSSSSAGIS
jgi:Yip1 domain